MYEYVIRPLGTHVPLTRTADTNVAWLPQVCFLTFRGFLYVSRELYNNAILSAWHKYLALHVESRGKRRGPFVVNDHVTAVAYTSDLEFGAKLLQTKNGQHVSLLKVKL